MQLDSVEIEIFSSATFLSWHRENGANESFFLYLFFQKIKYWWNCVSLPNFIDVLFAFLSLHLKVHTCTMYIGMSRKEYLNNKKMKTFYLYHCMVIVMMRGIAKTENLLWDVPLKSVKNVAWIFREIWDGSLDRRPQWSYCGSDFLLLKILYEGLHY